MYTKEDFEGKVNFSERYLSELVASTVTECFGVSGISSCSLWKRIKNYMLMGKSGNKGIYIRAHDNKLSVDIHIEVVFGTNIAAIKDSIVNKVSFTLEQATGTSVDNINIYVDNVK